MSIKLRPGVMMTIISTLILIAATSFAQWVLPVADYDEVEPSPPSIQGYLVDTDIGKISVNLDRPEGPSKDVVIIQLTSNTEFFSAYGGIYKPDELSRGQYVWVWYITEDPAKAGIPPQAAVVMLWSLDPLDKPSKQIRWGETRWHYGKGK